MTVAFTSCLWLMDLENPPTPPNSHRSENFSRTSECLQFFLEISRELRPDILILLNESLSSPSSGPVCPADPPSVALPWPVDQTLKPLMWILIWTLGQICVNTNTIPKNFQNDPIDPFCLFNFFLPFFIGSRVEAERRRCWIRRDASGLSSRPRRVRSIQRCRKGMQTETQSSEDRFQMCRRSGRLREPWSHGSARLRTPGGLGGGFSFLPPGGRNISPFTWFISPLHKSVLWADGTLINLT